MWDPLAGDYRTATDWIRLHTNYSHHRDAVVHVLGVHDRAGVEAAVATLPAEEIERAVVAAGGAAATLHTREAWLDSAAGRAARDAPPITVREHPGTARVGWAQTTADLPLSGVRFLDLTRVIAGPVYTKILAGYGAEVLRIDPPGFTEVASLLSETTLGKRAAALDLANRAGRSTFEELVRTADVIVMGYRADALERIGYDRARLAALNPGLITAQLNAYGWAGPWRNRRGFDSLVQFSCGIAATGASAYAREEPVPLPVQALDHASGWLLATAITRALHRRLSSSTVSHITGSLIGTANLPYAMSPPDGPPVPGNQAEPGLEETQTDWGPALRVPLPGHIAGVQPVWAYPAGPLARHGAQWTDRP
ncbi:CoA transferase [Brevibacterium sp. 50QC2O2]|uniref:CoA transferase n=1 Tax=Brevibacterium TaxID=1696 RepID=UPI00211BEAC4|nr:MULTISPECIES: CoA transferase [unclassified Brevibacterium]MCQ9366646.1 CoA transferase [Brevibacterium sp. 91QC2O2]MCQ9384472.1 CoA transferase [Brevibacterium sp. 68QC2CO]MCQ9389614.1 CoA transferase [Brevibacterium sp. 50QC2O2]